jgi:hypothetical protein
MKKITKLGPKVLVNMNFNIPVFNAEKQMYVCTNVDELEAASGGKTYFISLSEVKEHGYNVPEKIEVTLFVPTTDANGELANLNMVEVADSGPLPLAKIITKKQNISSLGGLKQIFYKMGKKM